ncbi:hypothetical protein ACTMTI_51400 [Nonomuraea sp. H19]|uniref:hypothetical protein n=1 Tax=Nonomuraea sp. H19 TaxID=3452206 RepID=UPI003F89E933
MLAQQSFPVSVDAGQQAALQELRDGLDAYSDLLVADAVHHLVEGRPEAAGAVMNGAAGLARPPELGLLRTPREGRAVSSSVVLALAHIPAAPLPADDDSRSLLSPAGTLDPSVAAYLAATAGAASAWDFEVRLTDPALATAIRRVVHLTELDLEPADALALTRTRLESLAVERAAELEGVDLGAPGTDGIVVAGTGGHRYEHAASLVGLVGRNPAEPRTLSEEPSTGDPVSQGEVGIDPLLLQRYLATRDVCAALLRRLRGQVELLEPEAGIGGADPEVLRRLLTACAGWGIAPNPPDEAADQTEPPAPADQRRVRRLARAAVLALAGLAERLAAAPRRPTGCLGRSSSTPPPRWSHPPDRWRSPAPHGPTACPPSTPLATATATGWTPRG